MIGLMKRWYQILLVTLFTGTLTLPLIVSFLLQDMNLSATEKRTLSSIPPLPHNLKELSSYPDRYEKYYEDHFGFREHLITAYNWLYLKILDKSPNPKVIVGADDWLFFTGDHTLDDFLGVRPPGLETMEQWRRTILDRREWLEDQNILYLPVIIPYKMMVYPEKLPRRIGRYEGQAALDQFMAYLSVFKQEHELIDLRPPLVQAKQSQQVYFKTDTHWNLDGAFIAYNFLLERIQLDFPMVKILKPADLLAKDVLHSGDISMLLHLSETLAEPARTYQVLTPCSRDYVNIQDYIHPQKQFAHIDAYLPVMNGCTSQSLSALVIHDSFGLFLRPFMNETFGQIIYSNFAGFTELKDLIQEHHPDVVIDTRVARNIASMLKFDKKIERDILEKHIEQSNTILLQLGQDRSLPEGSNLHQMEIVNGADGLMLNALGSDPFVGLSHAPSSGNRRLLAEIIITAPENTQLQLFYTLPGQDFYTPAQALSFDLNKGHNRLLTRLPKDAGGTKIRLDPGQLPGKYILHSLLIKEEP